MERLDILKMGLTGVKGWLIVNVMKGKIRGLSKKELLAITEYKELLREELPGRIKRIILFGSKARGRSSRNSDIDLLVVLKKNGKRISRQITGLTHGPIAKYMVDISPIVVEDKFFHNWSPLLAHIKEDGIPVWINNKAGENTLS